MSSCDVQVPWPMRHCPSHALDVEGCVYFWPYALGEIWHLIVLVDIVQLYWYGVHLTSPSIYDLFLERILKVILEGTFDEVVV